MHAVQVECIGTKVLAVLPLDAPDGWTFLDAVHWPGRPGRRHRPRRGRPRRGRRHVQPAVDRCGRGPRRRPVARTASRGCARPPRSPRRPGRSARSSTPAYRTTVSAFVCAVQHDVVPATVSPGVNVVGVREVDDAVGALAPRLSPLQVAEVLEQLRGALVGPADPDQLTTRALTVYGDGPALPWPGRADDGLFGPPGGLGDVPPSPRLRRPGAGPGRRATGGGGPRAADAGCRDRLGRPVRAVRERGADPAADLPPVQGGTGSRAPVRCGTRGSTPSRTTTSSGTTGAVPRAAGTGRRPCSGAGRRTPPSAAARCSPFPARRRRDRRLHRGRPARVARGLDRLSRGASGATVSQIGTNQ